MMKQNCCIFLLLSILCCACYCDIILDIENKVMDFISPLKKDKVSKEIAREVHMAAPEMIAYYGYKAEVHTAKTEDGYFLGLQRIPKSKKGEKPHQPYPVLMQHGVLCCSGNYIDNGAESLGFFLADKGYDVWLGNLRGNRYSNKHVTLSEDDPKFWDFSYDEHANYDLPAMIDYVRNVTKKEQILLVSHSLGTTVTFAMLAALPEYNKKIKGFLAMGPITSVTYSTSIAVIAAKFDKLVRAFFKVTRIKEIDAHSRLVEDFLLHFCPGTDGVCNLAVGSYSGYDSHLTNKTRFPIYLSDCAGGTSVKIVYHLIQLYKGGQLAHFDYGSKKNKKIYGQETAPIYDVSKITTPVVLGSAPNDPLADPLDVAVLKSKLKTVIDSYIFPDPSATHSVFFWLRNGIETFFNKFLELLEKLVK